MVGLIAEVTQRLIPKPVGFMQGAQTAAEIVPPIICAVLCRDCSRADRDARGGECEVKHGFCSCCATTAAQLLLIVED
jgi:hypothetical protein